MKDLGLFTCDPGVTGDLINLFNYMTGRSRQMDYQKLLVAPVAMKSRFLELIEREILLHSEERPGHIIAKMNQLEDRSMTEALYSAAQQGVRVDLIIRGFCCLRPGVEGLSENIRVVSLIGRFLEHSRIYWFSGGCDDPMDGDYYIGSADWMYRNLHARIEAITPVESRRQRERLWRILQMSLEDQVQAWEMQSNGLYAKRSTDDALDPQDPLRLGIHQRLMDDALE